MKLKNMFLFNILFNCAPTIISNERVPIANSEVINKELTKAKELLAEKILSIENCEKQYDKHRLCEARKKIKSLEDTKNLIQEEIAKICSNIDLLERTKDRIYLPDYIVTAKKSVECIKINQAIEKKKYQYSIKKSRLTQIIETQDSLRIKINTYNEIYDKILKEAKACTWLTKEKDSYYPYLHNDLKNNQIEQKSIELEDEDEDNQYLRYGDFTCNFNPIQKDFYEKTGMLLCCEHQCDSLDFDFDFNSIYAEKVENFLQKSQSTPLKIKPFLIFTSLVICLACVLSYFYK